MNKKVVIKGMMCVRCQARVQKGLAALEGVSGCEVDLASGVATLSLTTDVADEIITAKVKELGYTPVEVTIA